MIYTLTLNPALDRELTVARLEHNRVLRASASRADVGGKGFNVSRMLAALGEPGVAVAIAGGDTGRQLEHRLRMLNITPEMIWVWGETRTNISIVAEHGGDHIKVNEPGPQVNQVDLDALFERIKALKKPDDVWVLSGSLPPGAPEDLYATLCRVLREGGCRVAIDTSGRALGLACAAGPWMVKPNREELSALTGATLGSENDVIAAGRDLLNQGPQVVLVSLGRDGALMITPDAVWRAGSAPIIERNPIGAGDCFTAGFVWAATHGHPLPEALRWASACGAAAASLPGTAVGDRLLVSQLKEQIQCARV